MIEDGWQKNGNRHSGRLETSIDLGMFGINEKGDIWETSRFNFLMYSRNAIHDLESAKKELEQLEKAYKFLFSK